MMLYTDPCQLSSGQPGTRGLSSCRARCAALHCTALYSTAQVVGISKEGGVYRVRLADGRELTAARVILAPGAALNSSGLLHQAGVSAAA